MAEQSFNRRQVLNTLAIGGLTTAVLAGSVPTLKAAERHPRIRAAIKELREARKELEDGAKIFGGHRVKAIKAVDDAIDQLKAALDYADKN